VTAHRKSIIKQAIERFDGLMAIGESRGKAKEAAREAGEYQWGFTTGKIHSFKTRSTYQEHTLKFITWARITNGIKTLEQLDSRADELATIWLNLQCAERKSGPTLQTQRAALRMFFGNRQLAANVTMPRRTRESITRSRGAKAHDRHFQPTNWPELVRFAQATGLRRHELRALRCDDIHVRDGQVQVHVKNGKGGLARDVPVLAGCEANVLVMRGGRDPEALVFERIPKHVDVHSYRREYAQALYLQYAPGRALPRASGRLRRSDYDREAAERVSLALGHRRVDVILRHYLR